MKTLARHALTRRFRLRHVLATAAAAATTGYLLAALADLTQ
ncbi:MAG: hypothetical protein ACLGHM_09710 [Actinomycetes bacterium]